MTARLDGRAALVTGGGSGIGRACALRFAAEGAEVVVADVSAERAAGTVGLVAASGGRAYAFAADISREEENERLVAAAREVFGRLDVLVAAAGILHARYDTADPSTGQREHQDGYLVRKPLEHWEKVLAVNLTGTMLTNRAFAAALISQGTGGAIVNIASGAAVSPLPGSADYCVSKAGVVMLTKVLALEVASHGIRVNAIAPGAIATPMIAATLADESRKRRAETDTPLGRIGQPDDIAGVALFLASDDASYITGEVLFPTGGRLLGR
jgi:NAD(P)-dependent dehydrogenase (short-subunit alcohol dehydrogenase family)